MRDLRVDLDNVWRLATRLNAPDEGGRSIMFIAAHDGAGTSSLAASFALMAAEHAQKSAWLVELDVSRNIVFKAFEAGFGDEVGRPGRAYDASLRQTPFYTLSPSQSGSGEDKLLTVHQISGQKLLVTRFRNDRVAPGVRIRLRAAPGWWQALRKASDWAVVDAPALSRSSAGLAVASEQDGVVLVVEADRTLPREVVALREEIEAVGGKIIGVALNRVRTDARCLARMAG